MHFSDSGYLRLALILESELFPTGKSIFASEQESQTKLRQAIIAKNRLYFHSWRPQNITYLFLFRKHEQGQNAKEVKEFLKLVAEKEKEIDRLKKPKAHTYELIRVEDGTKK